MSEVLIIKTADQTYGLNVDNVFEILKISKITSLPGSSEYFLGIVDIRGQIYRVIDTNKVLGLESPNDYQYFIIVEIGDNQYVLMAEEVISIVPVSEDLNEENTACVKIDTSSNAMITSMKFIESVYTYKKDLVSLLSLQGVESVL